MAQVDEVEAPELEAAEENKPTKGEGKKKSGLKMNLIIIFAVQLVLAVAGFYFVSNFVQPDPALQKVLAEQKTKDKNNEAGADQKGKDESKADAEEPKEIYMLENIVVNPAGTGGSRYLSVSIGVEMNAAHEGEKSEGGHGGGEGSKPTPLDRKKPELKDALINILSAKTIAELTSSTEKEKIRQEILVKFKEILDPLPVYQIYFVDFVLQ